MYQIILKESVTIQTNKLLYALTQNFHYPLSQIDGWTWTNKEQETDGKGQIMYIELLVSKAGFFLFRSASECQSK